MPTIYLEMSWIKGWIKVIKLADTEMDGMSKILEGSNKIQNNVR